MIFQKHDTTNIKGLCLKLCCFWVAFQLLGLEKVLIKKKFENLFEDVKIYFLS